MPQLERRCREKHHSVELVFQQCNVIFTSLTEELCQARRVVLGVMSLVKYQEGGSPSDEVEPLLISIMACVAESPPHLLTEGRFDGFWPPSREFTQNATQSRPVDTMGVSRQSVRNRIIVLLGKNVLLYEDALPNENVGMHQTTSDLFREPIV